MTPRLGSLFSGAGALDLAVHEVLGAETVFVADVCKVDDGGAGHHTPCRAPCTILAHRFPDAPNLGDVSAIDWAPWVGQVDVIAAGFPCQGVSVAGLRRGLRDARSGLWAEVVRAIRELQPKMVILENVPGIFTAPAAGDVEPCPWCVGDGAGSDMRALDAVLADLATLGWDAEWTTVPASDVGAPHKRFRWFCVAYPANTACARLESWAASGQAAGRWASDLSNRSDDRADALALLPTPSAADAVGGHERRGGSRGDELLLKGIARAATDGSLLPTPTAMDANSSGGNPHTTGSHGTTLTDATARQPDLWGKYGSAIAQWERVLGRPAPAPTKPNANGNPKLSDEFDEWLMGWPAGWVTDVPGIGWNEALKACGNGVVTRQAAYALRILLGRINDLTAVAT